MAKNDNPYVGMDEASLICHAADLNAVKRVLNSELNEIARHANLIKAARKVAKPQAGLSISDHAVVRYLERVKGIDTVMIRQQIAGDIAEGAQVRAGIIRGRSRETYHIRDNTVVTVTPSGTVDRVLRNG